LGFLVQCLPGKGRRDLVLNFDVDRAHAGSTLAPLCLLVRVGWHEHIVALTMIMARRALRDQVSHADGESWVPCRAKDVLQASETASFHRLYTLLQVKSRQSRAVAVNNAGINVLAAAQAVERGG